VDRAVGEPGGADHERGAASAGGRRRIARWIWPHVRAALILLTIVFGLIDGAPIPTGKQVPEAIQPAMKTLGRTRGKLTKPVRPLANLFKVYQRWKLFPTAKRTQHWMWIELLREGVPDWQILYRPNDSEHAGMKYQVEYRRLRGGWNPGTRGTRTGYGPFVQWLAGEIFTAQPDVQSVRVRFEKIRIEPRRGSFVAEDAFEHRLVESRRRWERRKRR
jgi:hypothetical protein